MTGKRPHPAPASLATLAASAENRAPVSTPSGPRSAQALVAASGGRLTYRQLDYWIRVGWVTIECEASGSGSQRVFTDAEWQAVLDVVDEYERIHAQFERVRTGQFFAERLAANNDADVADVDEPATLVS